VIILFDHEQDGNGVPVARADVRIQHSPLLNYYLVRLRLLPCVHALLQFDIY
jgi:hypothetical protein